MSAGGRGGGDTSKKRAHLIVNYKTKNMKNNYKLKKITNITLLFLPQLFYFILINEIHFLETTPISSRHIFIPCLLVLRIAHTCDSLCVQRHLQSYRSLARILFLCSGQYTLIAMVHLISCFLIDFQVSFQ